MSYIFKPVNAEFCAEFPMRNKTPCKPCSKLVFLVVKLWIVADKLSASNFRIEYFFDDVASFSLSSEFEVVKVPGHFFYWTECLV